MPLSISSFRTPILVAVIGLGLFTAYNGALFFLENRIPAGPLESDADHNRAVIEAYLQGDDKEPVVITGSSLSARLPTDAFPEGAVSLAQTGGTALTGLNVILASRAHPKVVLVEVNYLWRAADETVLRNALGTAELSRLLPSLQVRFRPANLMLNLAKTLRGGLGVAPEDSGRDKRLYDAAVMSAVAVNLQRLKQAQVDHNIANVRSAVDRLEKLGTKVILVEMPVDPRLRSTARVRQIFDSVGRMMPADHYHWFRPPPGIVYETADGEHMIRSAAHSYAVTLANVR